MPVSTFSRLFKPLAGHRGAQQRIQLIAVAPVLRAADSGFIAELREGSFALAGHSVQCDNASPFDAMGSAEVWQTSLHGFGWLRHVAPHADAPTEQRVHALVAQWMAADVRTSLVAVRPSVVARRVLSWLSHADLLLQTHDVRFYDAVLGALGDDVRRLEQQWRRIEQAGDRWLAIIALAHAGLCIADYDALLATAEAALGAEVRGRQVTSLGTLLRSPDALANVLLDLEALRLLYGMRLRPVPEAVLNAEALLNETLNNLLLGDGRLARLGAPRDDVDAQLTLAIVTRHVGIADAPSCHDANAGFVRLACDETRIIIDVGAPFSSPDALGFEMSSGQSPLMVHDGLDGKSDPGSRGALVFSAATTAHTETAARATLPTLEPTHSKTVDITDVHAQSVDATHAGYARRGFVHRRRLFLGPFGRTLDGIDELRPLVGGVSQANALYSVRLVLHPSVAVVLGAATDHVELTLANDHRWRFEAQGRVLSVEGGVFCDGWKSLPTRQILVPTDAASNRCVTWRLTRIA